MLSRRQSARAPKFVLRGFGRRVGRPLAVRVLAPPLADAAVAVASHAVFDVRHRIRAVGHLCSLDRLVVAASIILRLLLPAPPLAPPSCSVLLCGGALYGQ